MDVDCANVSRWVRAMSVGRREDCVDFGGMSEVGWTGETVEMMGVCINPPDDARDRLCRTFVYLIQDHIQFNQQTVQMMHIMALGSLEQGHTARRDANCVQETYPIFLFPSFPTYRRTRMQCTTRVQRGFH